MIRLMIIIIKIITNKKKIWVKIIVQNKFIPKICKNNPKHVASNNIHNSE